MKKDMSFEEAMIMLDSEVKKLEGGNMTLEESLAAFESAVGLIKVCNEKLNSAEKYVRILTEGPDGTITDTSFDGACDEA